MESTGVRLGLLRHHSSIKEVGKHIQDKAACVDLSNLPTNGCFCQEIEWTECDSFFFVLSVSWAARYHGDVGEPAFQYQECTADPGGSAQQL